MAATLVHRAIGDQLTCVYVDHGLMRKRESELLRVTFERDLGMNLVMVDARDRFLSRLAGVEDPEEKRRIIGDEFIRVFEEEAARIGDARYLVQGTLYSDVIESGGGTGAATIKSHHNVGGLPEDLEFELVEPLRTLFKDEVRAVGLELGVPEQIIAKPPSADLWPGQTDEYAVGTLTRQVAEAARLLQEQGVAVMPGVALGAGGEGFFRIALTLPEARIREAAERMGRIL